MAHLRSAIDQDVSFVKKLIVSGEERLEHMVSTKASKDVTFNRLNITNMIAQNKKELLQDIKELKAKVTP